MSNLIKICGLRKLDEARAAVEAGATHIGFVFFPKSPRNISVDEAATIMRDMGAQVRSVALLVEPELDFLQKLVTTLAPDVLQFHGREQAAWLGDIKDKFGTDCEIWKALSIASVDDLAREDDLAGIVDRVLFDAPPPKDASYPGGHGVKFDWSILRRYRGRTPWVLAGGLTPENVAEAISQASAISRFCGVDVSSGVEQERGVKDLKKIRQFVKAANEAFSVAGART